MPCRDPMMAILKQFRPLFTAPTGKNQMTLLRGMLLARRRQTVPAALWQTGHHPDPHLSAFHQVVTRARWSPLEASRHFLSLILETSIQWLELVEALPQAVTLRERSYAVMDIQPGQTAWNVGCGTGSSILLFFVISGRTPESAGLRHDHPAHHRRSSRRGLANASSLRTGR